MSQLGHASASPPADPDPEKSGDALPPGAANQSLDPKSPATDHADIRPGLGRGFRRRRRRGQEKKRGLRLRRHGRRAYIRSVYFLPSLATLGNAVCGFGAMYVAGMASISSTTLFSTAAYLIFLAMVFDALDGRLARFARHTTDFGGQLDSLADVISFGAAPAFIAIHLFRIEGPELPVSIAHIIWAIGAMYMSCAAIRLARFNVSNEHGEQHHFSFLGLPSPGAASAVAGLVLMQQELAHENLRFLNQFAASFCVAVLPLIVLAAGLLMVSHLRYPHLVNRYMRGRRSIGRLIVVLGIALLLLVAHQYTLGIGSLAFAAWGPIALISAWTRRRFRATGASALPESRRSP